MKDSKIKNEKAIALIALIIIVIAIIVLCGLLIFNKSGKESSKKITQDSDEKLISAIDIKNNPTQYYGKSIYNYECSADGNGWKIFYSDGNNIYIKMEYGLQANEWPNTKAGNSKESILTDYIGASDITDNNVKKIYSYLDTENGKNNQNDSMKFVAYMLDTDVWNIYKGKDAEYAIGGPTLDLYCASYKDTHPDKYLEFKSEPNGYAVKLNTEPDYSNNGAIFYGLDFENYDIYGSTTGMSYYIASTGIISFSSDLNMAITYDYEDKIGGINYLFPSYAQRGVGYFCPIVCLSSDVTLIEDTYGLFIK